MVRKKYKKSQQTGSQAATLIGIITLLIVFYIIFVPPATRHSMLYGDEDSGLPSQAKILQNQTICLGNNTSKHFNYVGVNEFEYDLNAITICNNVEAETLVQENNFIVQKGWFSNQAKEISFNIVDASKLSNVLITASISSGDGLLNIRLNGKTIYNGMAAQNFPPLKINNIDLHNGMNSLITSVSNVGLKFWSINKYEFSDLKILSNILKDYHNGAKTSFYVPQEQSEDVDGAFIKFIPNCEEKGILHILVNGREIFSGLPDCDILNRISFDPSYLHIGQNDVYFSTPDGSFVLDQLKVITKIRKAENPVYYFDLSKDFFQEKSLKYDVCGEVDGRCPADCSADIDKDCCFEQNPLGFWCDAKTDILDDRCISNIKPDMCSRCLTGYEDKYGQPAPDCAKQCGDDSDEVCNMCCNINYDKDCCFSQPGIQYWCNDLPSNGLDFTCVNYLTEDSCKNCPSGYIAEEGATFSCDNENHADKEQTLKQEYDVTIEFKFADDYTDKELKYYVNGYEFGLYTKEAYYSKKINDYVEPGTNSVKIVPQSDLDIRTINIKVD